MSPADFVRGDHVRVDHDQTAVVVSTGRLYVHIQVDDTDLAVDPSRLEDWSARRERQRGQLDGIMQAPDATSGSDGVRRPPGPRRSATGLPGWAEPLDPDVVDRARRPRRADRWRRRRSPTIRTRRPLRPAATTRLQVAGAEPARRGRDARRAPRGCRRRSSRGRAARRRSRGLGACAPTRRAGRRSAARCGERGAAWPSAARCPTRRRRAPPACRPATRTSRRSGPAPRARRPTTTHVVEEASTPRRPPGARR